MTVENQGSEVTARVIQVRKNARKSLSKASSEPSPVSNTASEDPFTEAYKTDVLEPPYDLQWLSKAHEYNSILGACVDSMALNTVGFGYHLEPTIDLDKIEEGPERDKLKAAMDEEKERIESFFDYCHADKSFAQISTNRAFDKHLIGNGYMEVLRFANGDIAGLEHAQAYTMRLMKQDVVITTVATVRKKNKTDYEEILIRKKFRRFCQVKEGKRTYFKEFGDPRVVDANTGEYLNATDENGRIVPIGPDYEARLAKTRKATEILHFQHYCPYSPYGVPKWMGNLLAVTGSRAYEEINANFADNKAVPPLAITVSGGTLSDKTVERIQGYVENNIKGRDNFHAILVLETDAKADPNLPPGQTARGAIQIQPLSSAIQSDEVFANYDERQRKKIRGAFRLPPIYSGESQDYTRATAEESASTAEKQVFSPERMSDDFIINRKLFSAMRVRYWTYVSNTSVENSPVDQAELYAQIKDELTMNEARAMVSKITNVDLPPLDDDWAKKIPLGKLEAMLAEAARKDAQAILPASGAVGEDKKGKEGTEDVPDNVEEIAKSEAKRMYLIRKHIQELSDADAEIMEREREE